MQVAAGVAYRFRIDPKEVLDSDYFDWALRVAAANYVAEELDKANKAATKK